MERASLENQAFLLNELVDESGILEGFAFLNCRFIGPAVLFVERNCELDSNHFFMPGETGTVVVRTLRHGDAIPSGLIRLRNVSVRRSTFYNVGVVLGESLVDRFSPPQED